MDTYQTHLGRLEEAIDFLPDKPEETPSNTLRALWFAAAGTPKSAQAAEQGELPPLTAAASAKLTTLMARRLRGEPLAYITGRQRFMGLEMLATDEALVPRRETELLAESAIKLVAALHSSVDSPLVLDACTGSGNVALAIAQHCSNARLLAADLSEQAVIMARRNAVHLGLEARVEFRTGDLLEPFRLADIVGRVDVLTCNPPYISSAKVKSLPDEIGSHEPQMAFDGGPLGIGILVRLVNEAPAFLRAGGWLVFEIGLGQGPSLVRMMKKMPAYKEVVTSVDKAGDIRVIMARC
jgi:release factor glutamine methyltransferase